MRPWRLAAAISGRGSNLRALLDTLPSAEGAVAVVLSDRASAGGLELARDRGIPTAVLTDPADPAEWAAVLGRYAIDLVVLAGYLKLVPREVVARWAGRIINIHPALLPDFGGPGMYGLRVHRAVLASGARESGATVHLVDAEYDRGPTLAQARVPVLPDDTPESLAARVLAVEHTLLPRAVLAAIAAGRAVPFSYASVDT